MKNDRDTLTIEEIAGALGIKVQRTRQILNKAIRKKLISKPKRIGASIKLAYTAAAIEKLKGLYHAGEFGKPRNRSKSRPSKSGGHKPRGRIRVVLELDAETAALARKLHASEDDLKQFLLTKLDEALAPAKEKLKRLEEEFERERKEIFSALKP